MSKDRVQPLKMESIVSGGDSEDDYPTSLDRNHDFIDGRGIVIQNHSSNDDAVAVARDASDNLTFEDPVTGSKTLAQLAAGGGMTPNDHRVLDQLVHNLAEDYYEEYTYVSGKVTNVTTWETSGKLKKIREEDYAYVSGKIDTVTTKQYDGTGTQVEHVVETYAYTGSRVDSVTAVRSAP